MEGSVQVDRVRVRAGAGVTTGLGHLSLTEKIGLGLAPSELV